MDSPDPGPVRRFVQGLGRTDRYVVMLHYADGLSLSEVAMVLEMPVEAVEAVLLRTRGLLAEAVATACRQERAGTGRRSSSAA